MYLRFQLALEKQWLCVLDAESKGDTTENEHTQVGDHSLQRTVMLSSKNLFC